MTEHSIQMDVAPELLPLMKLIPSLAPELGKESDRGCALLVGCILEKYLRASIAQAIAIPNKASHFMGRGQIGKGIESAECLGLISAVDAKALKATIQIRNDFAHVAEPGKSFSSPEVEKAVVGLYSIYRHGDHAAVLQAGARQAYVSFSLSLCSLLLARADQITRRAPPADLKELTDRMFFWWFRD
ncbi:hypothetical protein [Pseudoxanthomonas sp. JBR18]|uniref:hypothetical protein n=1 Tax=Pseudoxanthomonas sp. JBR18 TaxID=2969308 RepID=UPI002304D65B|nr:hypothetical protein [Pseudoxanthomonas sp. JBR18]WCE02816.1 hypothetical protein PJ250_11745 [Pseudoxanthomonas sp. JBR18]